MSLVLPVMTALVRWTGYGVQQAVELIHNKRESTWQADFLARFKSVSTLAKDRGNNDEETTSRYIVSMPRIEFGVSRIRFSSSDYTTNQYHFLKTGNSLQGGVTALSLQSRRHLQVLPCRCRSLKLDMIAEPLTRLVVRKPDYFNMQTCCFSWAACKSLWRLAVMVNGLQRHLMSVSSLHHDNDGNSLEETATPSNRKPDRHFGTILFRDMDKKCCLFRRSPL